MFVMGLRRVCSVEPVCWRLGVSGRVEAVPIKPPSQMALVTAFLSALRLGFSVPVKVYPSWYSEVVEAVEVVVSVAVVEVVVSVEEVVEEVVEGQEPTSGPGTRETASSSVWRVIVETVETVEETTIEETVEFVGRVGAHERPRSSGGGNVAGLVGVIVRRIGPRSKLREEKESDGQRAANPSATLPHPKTPHRGGARSSLQEFPGWSYSRGPELPRTWSPSTPS
jgi:hypothetical protein